MHFITQQIGFVFAGILALIGLSLGIDGKLTALQAIVITSLFGAGFYFVLRFFRPLTDVTQKCQSILQELDPQLKNESKNPLLDAVERLQAELDSKSIQLLKNQQRFDAVLGSMTEGVIAVDSNTKILFLNQAAKAILSIGLENLEGKPLSGLVRYEAVQQATREALQTKQTISADFRTHDQRPRFVKLRVAPMSGTEITGLTLVLHDVTELKRLETIRRDFVANVSHELKTPLASIKGYAETLLMGALHKEPENQLFVERINKQADLLSQQIHDLLHLARVESGREAYQFEAIDLVELSQVVVDLFESEAEGKLVRLSFVDRVAKQQESETARDEQELSLTSESAHAASGEKPDVGESSCYVWADPEGLRTVLINLVSNAIRYTHIAGGQRNSIVTVVVAADDVNAWVEVIDNGVGIAKEHQERIFERFFRVDPARSRDQGGTGLGLAIVKHLLQSFHGQVELESKPGRGSTFRAVLPRYFPTESNN